MTDCQHPTVTWEPYVLHLDEQIKTVHWFACDWCPLKARLVTTDVNIAQ